MDTATLSSGLSPSAIIPACEAAARAIPPVWPLASSVAVNPYLGQAGETLAQTGVRLARIGRTEVTMPRDWYAARLADGTIRDEDLTGAIAASRTTGRPGVDEIRNIATMPDARREPQPSIAELAAAASGIDWPGIIADRFGHWAADYFDQGQALWAAPRRRNAFEAWRQYAVHDLTPEIAGLKGFAQFVADAPDTAADALHRSLNSLGLPEAALETYLHQLLFSLGGWAQVARHQMWKAEMAGDSDQTITDLLTIRIMWEAALFAQYHDLISDQWNDVGNGHCAPLIPDADLVANGILQEAWERAVQRDLAATLADPSNPATDARPALQAAFCIDVRSEVFRRALEAVSPDIRTLGFAGFFGLTAAHKGFASDVEELRLPVLLNPGLKSTCAGHDTKADHSARFAARAKRAWGRFKLAAVSSFAFVEATGPVYAGKLFKDALSLAPGAAGSRAVAGPAPRVDPAMDIDTRINTAETILQAMSMTGNFARLVVLAGHGANVVNNPFASGLHCGACGGYSGEVNARLLAALLNEDEVRKGLAARGIAIPDDTRFIGALHDTTTDAMTLFDADLPSHAQDVKKASEWFAAAGQATRGERALRLPRANNAADIGHRSRNWAETMPEWALAGCKAFIAAPRHRTSGKSLEGRAFLHEYDWKADSERGFGVLELIMTAPVVVASWISLQYYGSVVSPQTFGSGNKLLHNVVGGIGVLEGNGGVLRAGLPWQSVHDGEKPMHDPLRLSVCIEAPKEQMSDILERHDGVRALFDNRWLHLFALDDCGRMAWRYVGDLQWEAMPALQDATGQARAA